MKITTIVSLYFLNDMSYCKHQKHKIPPLKRKLGWLFIIISLEAINSVFLVVTVKIFILRLGNICIHKF